MPFIGYGKLKPFKRDHRQNSYGKYSDSGYVRAVIDKAVTPCVPAAPCVGRKENSSRKNMAGELYHQTKSNAAPHFWAGVGAKKSGISKAGKANHMFNKNLGPVNRLPGGKH